MATKQQALRAIAASGAILDQEMAELGNFTLDAPVGKIFLANSEPSYLAGVWDREDARLGFGPTMSEIYDDIIMTCNLGLVDGVGSEQ